MMYEIANKAKYVPQKNEETAEKNKEQKATLTGMCFDHHPKTNRGNIIITVSIVSSQ